MQPIILNALNGFYYADPANNSKSSTIMSADLYNLVGQYMHGGGYSDFTSPGFIGILCLSEYISQKNPCNIALTVQRTSKAFKSFKVTLNIGYSNLNGPVTFYTQASPNNGIYTPLKPPYSPFVIQPNASKSSQYPFVVNNPIAVGTYSVLIAAVQPNVGFDLNTITIEITD
jgi:hypothetical protein